MHLSFFQVSSRCSKPATATGFRSPLSTEFTLPANTGLSPQHPVPSSSNCNRLPARPTGGFAAQPVCPAFEEEGTSMLLTLLTTARFQDFRAAGCGE